MPILLVLLLAIAQVPPPTSSDGWTAAGWAAMRSGDTTRASADFAEALRLNGANALALLGAGAAANLQGKTDDARLALTRALQEDPSLTVASLLLGELLYRGGDLDGAIAVYERARERAPADARLSARLDAWHKEAAVHETLSTKIATHFTILFEGPPDQTMAGRVSDMLESIYWQVGSAIGAYPADVLTVILYSKEQFRDVTQSPSWAGGLYDGRIRVPVAGTIDESDLRRVLTHEFTHAVVHSIAPRTVPVWLNEGLAVLMERGGTAPPLPDNATVPALRGLEGSFEKLSPSAARLAYATSANAVQALLDRVGPMTVFNLLTNLGNGMTFDEAFARAALMPYDEFKRTWR